MLFNALFFLTGLLISSTKNSLELSITELTAISTLIVALLLTFHEVFLILNFTAILTNQSLQRFYQLCIRGY